MAAGGALAVDRDRFSAMVTEKIRDHPLITVREGEVTEIPDGNVIIATGPLTSEALSAAIGELISAEYLSFFDAAAPIVGGVQHRYGQGVLRCPVRSGGR